MTNILPIKILLVDDEPTGRKILASYLSKYPTFEIYEAENGKDGLRAALEKIPDVIISDYYMPVLDGIELCRRVKSVPQLASVIFILLSVEKDASHQVKAFESGVDDYIDKATSPVILTGKINSFLRLKQLQKELEVEKEKFSEANLVLERNFRELTTILLRIIDIKVIGASDRAEIARKIAEHTCAALDLTEDATKRAVFAAQLHEIGKIGLPEGFADKRIAAMSPDERTIFNQYTIIGSRIISTISGFDGSAEAIYHQLENYDGSGIPDGLMGPEIPMGARIIRSVVLQEELARDGHPSDEIIQEVRRAASNILDPVVATSLAEFIIESDSDFSQNKRKIHIEELQPGMVIAEDVYAISGVKLLPKGMTLQEHTLQVLMERNSRDPIIGGVYVAK